MTLSRALDKAVREENARFLADPAAQADARALGDLYRRVGEAIDRGFVQKPYPEETLVEFCIRAGTLDAPADPDPFGADPAEFFPHLAADEFSMGLGEIDATEGD